MLSKKDSQTEQDGSRDLVASSEMERLDDTLGKALEGIVVPGKEEQAKAIVTGIIAEMAPIPLPSQMGEYEKILPGITQQFMDMQKEVHRHREKMDAQALDTNKAINVEVIKSNERMHGMVISGEKFGMLVGGAVAVLFIGFAGFMVAKGHATEAVASLGLLGGVIIALRFSKKSPNSEQPQNPQDK